MWSVCIPGRLDWWCGRQWTWCKSISLHGQRIKVILRKLVSHSRVDILQDYLSLASSSIPLYTGVFFSCVNPHCDSMYHEVSPELSLWWCHASHLQNHVLRKLSWCTIQPQASFCKTERGGAITSPFIRGMLCLFYTTQFTLYSRLHLLLDRKHNRDHCPLKSNKKQMALCPSGRK